MRKTDVACTLTLALFVNLGLPGCSGDEAVDTGGRQPAATGTPSAPPTVSLSSSTSPADSAAQPSADELTEGSPRWLLREIVRLRAKPAPKLDDLDQRRAARRQRNDKIITLATQAISVTHDDPDQEQMFNLAVKQLLEARLQIALLGNRDDIEALYADVEQLDNRDPDSTAAAEGAFALARFTHTMARGHAGRSVDWVREFSRQARSFAGRFPDQAYRFVPQLFAAARSCELHNLNTEAIHCYTMLKDHFTETIQGQQSISILRRLNLVGQRPEIAGSTPDGGDVAIGDYAGRVVLVVFWSSENTTFRKLAPTLVELSRDYRKNGLEILGVNLDKEETDVDGFLEKVALPGRHIFFSHRDQRRWENPIAKFYGISDIPTLWLVDRQGRVVNTRVTSEALDRDVRKLLAAGRRTASND